MTPIPKTIGSEISALINALLLESEAFWDPHSQRILEVLDLIGKLQKVDAREAFTLKGHVYSLCGSVAEMDENFRKAFHLPDKMQTTLSYWFSLLNLGLYKKASEYSAQILSSEGGFFPAEWARAVSAGQPLEVFARLEQAMKTYLTLNQEEVAHLSSVAASMNRHGLKDADILDVLDMMGEIQREHGVMFSGTDIAEYTVMIPPDSSSYLYMTVKIDVGVVELRAMNRNLNKRLANIETPDGVREGLVAAFTSSERATVRAAA